MVLLKDVMVLIFSRHGQDKKCTQNLFGKCEGRDQSMIRCKWEGNIEMRYTEIERECIDALRLG
jgi:hypothetical protein